ncbi:hypothetical protein [Faecalibacillus intestinalis]|nr:hypothetical protein [Faecalibacillus intestinalis]
MKSEKVKEMLDSCYMAKRILDMLPKLPERSFTILCTLFRNDYRT